MRKNNLKIQIFAGNTLMSRFNVGFEIELPLDMSISFGMSEFFNSKCAYYYTFPTYLAKLIYHDTTNTDIQGYPLPSYCRIQANSTVWQFFTHFWHVKVLSVNTAKGIYLGVSSPRNVAIVSGNFGSKMGSFVIDCSTTFAMCCTRCHITLFVNR